MCLENPHGQRSLGYSPWSRKESDTTEQLSTAQHNPTVPCGLVYEGPGGGVCPLASPTQPGDSGSALSQGRAHSLSLGACCGQNNTAGMGGGGPSFPLFIHTPDECGVSEHGPGSVPPEPGHSCGPRAHPESSGGSCGKGVCAVLVTL